jgi:hypothetical protein
MNMIHRLSLSGAILVLCHLPLQAEETPLAACRESINLALKDVESKYSERLEKMRNAYQNAGNLEGYLATDAEMKRFQKDLSISKQHLNEDFETLHLTQISILEEVQRIQFELATKYLMDLNTEKVNLTKQGKIDEAIAKKKSMEAIEATYREALQRFGNKPESKKEAADATQSLVAENFARFCVEDEATAQAVFAKKEILVTGPIDSFGTSNPAATTIFLETADDMSQKIECLFNWRDLGLKISQGSTSNQLILIRESPVEGLEESENVRNRKNTNRESTADEEKIIFRAGKSLRVIGQYDGNHVNVRLVNCRLPDLEENPRQNSVADEDPEA